MIAVAVLFLIPIYYLARSKGYNAKWVCILSGAISFFTPWAIRLISGVDRYLFPYADISVPAVALFVFWVLPARKGAPGKAYLTIRFNCPECKAEVSFKRHEEGTVVMCPKCREIITVPEDEFSPKKTVRTRTRPSVSEGKVCFDSYANEEKALEVQAALGANGVESSIMNSSTTGVVPTLSFGAGFRVIIDVRDWDKANNIVAVG